MLHPITNESNEPVLPTVTQTEEPQAVAVPDSTAAPSKIGTSLTALAVLGLAYGLIVAAAGIIVGSPRYTGRGLAIYWILATLSAWVLLLLGTWSARSRRPYVCGILRYFLLALYGFHLWIGTQKLGTSESSQIVYY